MKVYGNDFKVKENTIYARYIPSIVRTISNFDKLFWQIVSFSKTNSVVVHDFTTRKHTKDLTTAACITRPYAMGVGHLTK